MSEAAERDIEIDVSNEDGSIISFDVKWPPAVVSKSGIFGETPVRGTEWEEVDCVAKALMDKEADLKQLILQIRSDAECTHAHSKVGKVISRGTITTGVLEDAKESIYSTIGLCVTCHSEKNMPPEDVEEFVEKIRPVIEKMVNGALDNIDKTSQQER